MKDKRSLVPLTRLVQRKRLERYLVEQAAAKTEVTFLRWRSSAARHAEGEERE